ncbi:MAG: hypothetical protein U1C33_08545, partial [Candidatus Cloacimonadaceae bacterium]|nr:hypothetical protein [Candidatus Cloacimonadaceae bacterium]
MSASTAPSASNGIITIQAGHTITLTSAVTIDQVIVEAGGELVLSSTYNTTLANGIGDDLTVFGTLRRLYDKYIVMSSGANIIFGDGGVYEHALTMGEPGNIVNATWHENSIARVMNSTAMSNAPGGLNQLFGIVEINTPNQTGNWRIDGLGDVRNELRVLNTGTGYLRTNTDFSISGSYNQSGGRFVNSLVAAGCRFSVGGNFLLSGGSFEISNKANSSHNDELWVEGDVLVLGDGVINLNKVSTTNTNSGHLYLKGDLIVEGGEIARTQSIAGGSTGLYFCGTAGQTFRWSGGIIDVAVLNRFYFQNDQGPTALHEIYNAPFSQYAINGRDGEPLSGFHGWPESGDLVKTITIDNLEGVSFTSNRTVNEALIMDSGTINLLDCQVNIVGTVIVYEGFLPAEPEFVFSGYHNPKQHIHIISLEGLPSDLTVSSNPIGSEAEDRIRRTWSVSGAALASLEITFDWTAEDDNNFNWAFHPPAVYHGAEKLLTISY